MAEPIKITNTSSGRDLFVFGQGLKQKVKEFLCVVDWAEADVWGRSITDE